MHIGKVEIAIQSAQLTPDTESLVFCVVDGPNKTRQCVQYDEKPGIWVEKVSMIVSPSDTGSLRFCFLTQKPSARDDASLGVALTSSHAHALLDITEIDIDRRVEIQSDISNPETGEKVGQVLALVRFFPLRSPGKKRDHLGREHIDAFYFEDNKNQGHNKIKAERMLKSSGEGVFTKHGTRLRRKSPSHVWCI